MYTLSGNIKNTRTSHFCNAQAGTKHALSVSPKTLEKEKERRVGYVKQINVFLQPACTLENTLLQA